MPDSLTITQYTVTLGRDTSAISATVRIGDVVQNVLVTPIDPGSALENSVLNLDAEVIAAIGAMFAVVNFKRPPTEGI